MDIKERLRLINANSFYGVGHIDRDSMIKEVEDILKKLRRENMYQYYTLEECYKLKKELHIPWKYIEECVGIKRTSLGHYKKVVSDPDAIKRASILYTVAIRSYMESGVATEEEKLLFINFESKK